MSSCSLLLMISAFIFFSQCFLHRYHPKYTKAIIPSNTAVAVPICVGVNAVTSALAPLLPVCAMITSSFEAVDPISTSTVSHVLIFRTITTGFFGLSRVAALFPNYHGRHVAGGTLGTRTHVAGGGLTPVWKDVSRSKTLSLDDGMYIYRCTTFLHIK